MRPSFKTQRGFSLIELAIVFAIIGIVLSGLWVYAGSVQEKSRREQLSQQMTTVVNNVRTLYSSQTGIDNNIRSITRLVPILIERNVFPSEMVRIGNNCNNLGNPPPPPPNQRLCADTPWGPGGNPQRGTFAVCGWEAPAVSGNNCPNGAGPAATYQYFAIELSGIAPDACINIAPQNSGSNGPSGIVDVVINNTSIMDPTAAVTHSLPVQVPDAQATCTANLDANGNATIDFVYRLRAPN